VPRLPIVPAPWRAAPLDAAPTLPSLAAERASAAVSRRMGLQLEYDLRGI
jgi:hypothetical protein